MLQEAKNYRVWLPFAKEELQVSNVKLLSTSQDTYHLSPNDSPQRTIYFEGKSKKYFVEFEYVITEWINKIDPTKVEKSTLNEYLDEKLPHIQFTPYLKWLTKNIVQDESNPYLKAQKIYDWISKNINYSYVLPYALYDNISQYAAENLKGDCGVKALLFITMCRITKVPARWQSGWYANPHYVSPHDWALFHVKPYGWLPADLSFGGARKDNEDWRQFYFANLDGFRMVANSEFSEYISPKPKFFRNDPTDNQLGEAESDERRIKTKSTIKLISFEPL